MNSRDKRRKAKANRVKSENGGNGVPVQPPMLNGGRTMHPDSYAVQMVVARGKKYGSPAPTPNLAKEPAPFAHSLDPDNEYARHVKGEPVRCFPQSVDPDDPYIVTCPKCKRSWHAGMEETPVCMVVTHQ